MSAKITIDYREHAETLKQELTSAGIKFDIKKLNLGDYIIFPDTVVERKTTKDFCISLIDGRLFGQAYRLAKFAETPIFIIEGKSFTKEIPVKTGINQIKGALISIAQTFRIPVLRTVDEADTAWHLKHLAEQRQRIGENKGSLCSYRPKKIQTKKEYVLRMFPGVGPKTARLLLGEFGSITNIVNASYDELLKVDGIGAKTAGDIITVIREDQAEYTVE